MFSQYCSCTRLWRAGVTHCSLSLADRHRRDRALEIGVHGWIASAIEIRRVGPSDAHPDAPSSWSQESRLRGQGVGVGVGVGTRHSAGQEWQHIGSSAKGA